MLTLNLVSYVPPRDVASVWRCHGEDPGRCPGGAPGVCARKRDSSSIASGECGPDLRWTSEGPCEICEVSDVSVLLIVIFSATMSLLSVYCAVVNENLAKNNEHIVLLATLCSQLVTVFQMMVVCKLLSVPSPSRGSLASPTFSISSWRCSARFAWWGRVS